MKKFCLLSLATILAWVYRLLIQHFFLNDPISSHLFAFVIQLCGLVFIILCIYRYSVKGYKYPENEVLKSKFAVFLYADRKAPLYTIGYIASFTLIFSEILLGSSMLLLNMVLPWYVILIAVVVIATMVSIKFTINEYKKYLNIKK